MTTTGAPIANKIAVCWFVGWLAGNSFEGLVHGLHGSEFRAHPVFAV